MRISEDRGETSRDAHEAAGGVAGGAHKSFTHDAWTLPALSTHFGYRAVCEPVAVRCELVNGQGRVALVGPCGLASCSR